MKLYTKEQIEIAINMAKDGLYDYDKILEELTPIELPSDEDMYQEAKSKGGLFVNWNMYETSAFVMGAQWMRDKIKGGEK